MSFFYERINIAYECVDKCNGLVFMVTISKSKV